MRFRSKTKLNICRALQCSQDYSLILVKIQGRCYFSRLIPTCKHEVSRVGTRSQANLFQILFSSHYTVKWNCSLTGALDLKAESSKKQEYFEFPPLPANRNHHPIRMEPNATGWTSPLSLLISSTMTHWALTRFRWLFSTLSIYKYRQLQHIGTTFTLTLQMRSVR